MEDRGDTRRSHPPSEVEPETDWHGIANSPEFERLEALRRRVTLGALSIFAVAFGTFLVLCAYARPFMRRSVDGGLTVAYVWLLGLTLLAWILVLSYLRFAERTLEPAARALVKRLGR